MNVYCTYFDRGFLAPGLALADVNLGPYVVALSKLDALSAPYHRLGKSIVEANRILLATPDEAERRLRADGVRYVITCAGLDSTTPPLHHQGPKRPGLRAARRWRGPRQTRKSGAIFPLNPEIA